MGRPLLLLRLEGPLQAWGLRARWDVRDSAREPTKSGVVGLLASALGYGRDDPRISGELEAGLDFGVRVEREATAIDDYHTVTGFFPMAGGGYKAGGSQRAATLDKLMQDPNAEPYTVQSTRRYLADGAFLVVLGAASDDAALVDRCAAALARPEWPLFLGRRTCVPTRPVLEGRSDNYTTIPEALARHPWSCLGVGATDREGDDVPAMLRVVVEADAPGVAREGRSPAARDDRRGAGAARLYGRRFVHEYLVPNPNR